MSVKTKEHFYTDFTVYTKYFAQRLQRVTLEGFVVGPRGKMDWMEEFFDEALANYELMQ